MPSKICPKCGKMNSAQELNYRMYGNCSHAFNDVMGYYKKKEEPIIVEPKTDLKGQYLLFGANFIAGKLIY